MIYRTCSHFTFKSPHSVLLHNLQYQRILKLVRCSIRMEGLPVFKCTSVPDTWGSRNPRDSSSKLISSYFFLPPDCLTEADPRNLPLIKVFICLHSLKWLIMGSVLRELHSHKCRSEQSHIFNQLSTWFPFYGSTSKGIRSQCSQLVSAAPKWPKKSVAAGWIWLTIQ